MQGKSKRNALILSAITVLAFAVTGFILNIMLPYWLNRVSNPQNPFQTGGLGVLLLFMVIILAMMIALGAFWLYRFFGEAHFVGNAPLRWALFGVLFAIFLKLPDWLLPAGWGIIRVILQLAGLFVAYFLARWIVPLRRSIR